MRPLFEYELLTAPVAYPVTRAEAKSACRVLSTDEDEYLDLLIDSATALLDGPTGFLGQAIGDQEWTVRCGPRGVCGAITLPFGPVGAVTAIKTHDGTTLNSQNLADFRILYGKFATTIEPVSGNWPTLADRADALQVTFDAGYEAAGVNGLGTVRQALLMQVAHWFNDRESADLAPGLAGLLVNEKRF